MFDADVGMRLRFPGVDQSVVRFPGVNLLKNWRLIVGFQVCPAKICKEYLEVQWTVHILKELIRVLNLYQ